MSNVIIDKSKIDILANAISCKSGEPVAMTLDEMVEAVDGIESNPEPTLQAKTYTVDSAGTETVTADSGYDGLSSVNVSVPSGSASGPTSEYTTTSYTTSYVSTDRQLIIWGYNISTTPIINAGYISEATASTRTVKINTSIPYNPTPTVSGATVTVPSGYYSTQASQTVASGTAGTPTATKGSVSNHQVSVTPSVINTSGYISGGTINGTAVTVTASELVSGSDTVTTNDTYDVTNLAELIVNVSGGGGVTVTDEANATGTTCVITSGGSPTPSGIPLNTELIDFTKLTEDYAINSSGEAVATQWYCASDYTAVDPSMTFSYTGCRWYYIGVYDSSKEVLRTIYIYNDGTADPDNSNLANGTLSGSELTGASYVRITGVAVQSQYRLSLIRTA